ncbi:uncharacterized protein LOC129596351 [Paramacrobiotus metropolitanus]|uniref:uncharacterized protein LOC129596351 n=1 Tax=Paramacrobiotus metropolitanus TaxID=2943436 RepID=UPI002445E5BB|nr:uncharacterized protein LOC129596351 [Paramacrobiotus metropolitanus]XP_055349567.1 uncharacterized protein LOC129596351 [Paramacrobiotus metropolitanus]
MVRHQRQQWITALLGVTLLVSPKVTATPGRVGCFYDLQLCESNELCYNDSLFGTCVSQLSDAVSYADLPPEALQEAARILQYLIETGYKWPDSYTQCVVGNYLQAVVSGQRYDPQVCEYLKQILSVIDQSRTSPVQAAPINPPAAVPQIATDVQVPVEPLTHGEFMSKMDGKADFDLPLMEAAPSSLVTDSPPAAAASVSADDAASYAALEQYLRQYQQAMAEQQAAAPLTVEKKSGSAEDVTTPAPEVTPTTPATADSTPTVNQTAMDQSIQTDAQAFDNLFAMLTSAQAAPTTSDAQVAVPASSELGVVPQTSELTAVPMNPPMEFVPESSPFEIIASDQQQMPLRIPFDLGMLQQNGFGGIPTGFDGVPNSFGGMPNNFGGVPNNFGGMPNLPPNLQFVPDFNALPPPGMFNSLDEMLLAQQMVAAQQQQSQFPPMMPMQQPQMDPRMLMDMSMFQPQMDPRLAMPQMLPNQFPFAPVPTKRGDYMSMPPMELLYQRAPPMFGPPMMDQRFGPPMMDQRMFDPMMMPPQLPQMPPMDMFGGFPAPPPNMGGFPPNMAGAGFPPMAFDQQQQLQMALPAGFAVIEPVMVDSNSSEEAIKQLFAESVGDVGSGAEGPAAQSKKDQEYKTLLPSNENQQSEVVEDVTVKVVKGSLPDDAVTASTDTQVKPEADDEEEYVFLTTEPQLSYDEARYLLNWLRAVMSLPVQTFYDLSVNDDLVTFRINPALKNLNATYIAQTFGDDELRSAIRGANGLQIKRAGVGHYSLIQAPGEDVPELRFEPTAIVETHEVPAAESTAQPTADTIKKYDVLDPTFAFIVTDPPLTYDLARRLLNWLAVQLQVPQTVFSYLHIEGNQLVFRVSPYFSRINASSVVEHLSDASIQSALRQQFAVEIIRAGIGDKVQVIKADNKQRQNLLIGLIAVACVAALLITLGIIYFVRRNLLLKKKLQSVEGDVESSKEYEELCRQRMASKNLEAGTVKSTPERDRTAHSSTSSWSEEPAPNNMDLTTGHMVLSYMEDHLKHKERLNEEWASLCTYEADPRQTDAASRKENLIKNRYPDVLPYDHTRVKLNPEGNVTKSDYINASLITDADPKNPAYIATQGPLPDTVADFWQMVWEQNCTVIVMLTRLRENDQDLCHVYWPKEGSEVYHNYEVHLVSEHIWCDDYLVRSFYLKHLRTHETRTVTQFHYLNWPNLAVPTSQKSFLEFRRKVNKCYKGGPSPIVVVCSDGVDRTGAYCLIDLVLNRMAKGVKEMDIAATLEHLRDQRMDMVRTKEQFEFVLTAVAQEIQAILKSMPQK